MARKSIQFGLEVFTLESSDGRVRASVVPSLGATVSSLVLPGIGGVPRESLHRRPWFWDRDAGETRGGIPPLFPICGRLLDDDGVPGRYRLGNASFSLPIHGFAMRMPWRVVDSAKPDALRLALASTFESRAAYPFAFELELVFRVAPHGFSCMLVVANVGTEPLPYAAGFHPYFATPPAGYGKEQTCFYVDATARRFYDGTKTAVVDSGSPPEFPMSVAAPEVNGLLLDAAPSGESRIVFPDSTEIRIHATPLFRFRQFYTQPDQPFFCDEAWMAPPNALNRLGCARILLPDQSETSTLRISRFVPGTNG